MTDRNFSSRAAAGLAVGICAVLLWPAFAKARGSARPSSSTPWTEAEVISPEALRRELSSRQKPVVVCVGFKFLYEAAHIPGAVYEGPAREASGLERLLAWAHSIPAGTPVVIYCGCCPFYECPNVRPAFEALKTAGLTHIQVLDLEHSFAKDWAGRGYPTEKQKP